MKIKKSYFSSNLLVKGSATPSLAISLNDSKHITYELYCNICL